MFSPLSWSTSAIAGSSVFWKSRSSSSMVSSGSRTVEAGVLCNLSRRQRRCWLTRVGFPLPSRNPRGKKVDFPDAPKAPEEEEGLKPNKAFYPLKKGLPRLCLSLLDSNPLSMVEAHPDKEGNSIDLGNHPVEEWCDSLGKALDLVAETVPTWYRELSSP